MTAVPAGDGDFSGRYTDPMTYPAADDPLLPETGPPAPLEYRPADAERPRHSRLGVAASIAALLSPITLSGLMVAISAGVRPPSSFALRVLLSLAVFCGPVAGLGLGTAALLVRGVPRRRRWPAVVAVTISCLMIALLVASALLLVRRR